MLTSTHLTLPSLPIAIVNHQVAWARERSQKSGAPSLSGRTEVYEDQGKFCSRKMADLISVRVSVGLSSTSGICFDS